MTGFSFHAGGGCEGRESHWPQAQIVRRVVVFVSLDVFVEIPDVNQKRRAFAAVQVGQKTVLNQPPELPLAHAEVFCGLPGTEETVLWRGRKTHMHLIIVLYLTIRVN
jgi:hypothetical protein